MHALPQALKPHRRHLRRAAIGVTLVSAMALLLWLRQPAGAALVPLVGLLRAEIVRRDRRAQHLAQRLAAGQVADKLEVQRGGWGELSRAVNSLLQERRMQQRLSAALPAPLPHAALQAFLGGALPPSGQPRMAAVLLVSYANRVIGRADHAEVAPPDWQALACAAQEQARIHGALLHPCGDAIMLAFGAFEDQPAGQALRTALVAADALQRGWRSGNLADGGPLLISLASGHALALALPGLGYCVVGAPVEQAVQLQHLARDARRWGLVCSEGVYNALRRSDHAGWQPTDLRIPGERQSPQVIYGRVERVDVN